MYQQITIIGNVGRDAEMRYLPDGKPLTSFSVATAERWKDAQGQAQERTTWFRVTVFGPQAEPCAQYVKKGMRVLVIGRVSEPKPYQNRSGEWAASLDVRADRVVFLSRVESDAATNNDAGPAPNKGPMGEEDIPF